MKKNATSWFRVGRLDVTTTIIVVGLGILGMVLTAVPPRVGWRLALTSAWLPHPWRLLLWPLAQPVSLWSAVNLGFLWYFGKEIEAALGRTKMALLFAGIWTCLTLGGVVSTLIFPGATLAGFDLVGLILVLLFILDAPNRPFFGGIPAWGIGLILIAVDVLQFISYSYYTGVLILAVGLLGSLLVAANLGYLREVTWLPRRQRKTAIQQTWERSAKEAKQRQADQERMDFLLDKIASGTLASLSERERSELKRLGEKRRAQR